MVVFPIHFPTGVTFQFQDQYFLNTGLIVVMSPESVMDSLSQIAMKILVFLLALTVQVFKTERVEDVFYYHNRIKCVKCPRGHKVLNHCTKDLSQSDCVTCEEGTFAVRLSSSKLCGKCKDCSHTYQIIKKNCTPETDTECKCPDKEYFYLDYCKSCEPPRIKRVRDEKEYCEDCESDTYYNSTVEDCVKCDICAGDQETKHVCNITHNTQCKQLPTTSLSTIPESSVIPVSSSEKNGHSISYGGIAGIGIGVAIILIIGISIGVLLCLKKKSCLRSNAHRVTEEEGRPLADSRNVELLSQSSQAHGNSNAKPAWMIKIRKILVDNLHPFDLFVAELENPEFNAPAKYGQLNDTNVETKFYKFMDMWYEQTNDPSQEMIMTALKHINRNDLVEKVKEQLDKTRNTRNDDQCVSCDNNCKYSPIQVSDDGQSGIPNHDKIDSVDNLQNTVESVHNTDMTYPNGTQPKEINVSDSDEEQQTNLKQPIEPMGIKNSTVALEQNITKTNHNGADPLDIQCTEIGVSDMDEDQTNPKQPFITHNTAS
ncbi:hypothetical protein LOTGIDRAFT_228863 [Lottia gigantea]|uniref:Tumor necrosis factor receptor superfamily member 6 n=1 Tax=Lottia gigantea TaxID=225164 RepID=V3ZJL9_LOTGI|nr:hypothetical protein LOTGIDRAFT_228863 [Lottia gigantea]ESO91473.1 hypothetical protein LOTGIDRAFT_228863 [Lottia gigantea]